MTGEDIIVLGGIDVTMETPSCRILEVAFTTQFRKWLIVLRDSQHTSWQFHCPDMEAQSNYKRESAFLVEWHEAGDVGGRRLSVSEM